MQFDETLADPTLADLAEAIVRETTLRVWASLPARVLEYFPPGADAVGEGRQPARVSLQVSIQRRRLIEKVEDLKPGETLDEPVGDEAPDRLVALGDYPPIPRAVVVRAGPGSPTMRFRGPVEAGTNGIAVFSARSLDRWATRSGQVDPVWRHAHEFTDAFFLPEARPGPAEVADPPAPGLWADDNAAGLALEIGGTLRAVGSAVELGTSPAAHAARAEDVDAAIADLKAKVAAVPVPADPSAAVAWALVAGVFAAWSPGSVASPTVSIP